MEAPIDSNDIPECSTPVALDKKRCRAMAAVLRAARDPNAAPGQRRLLVKTVYASHDPDVDGRVEVNYRDDQGNCRTAWMKGPELLYVEEGW